jgi:hypothetical protein
MSAVKTASQRGKANRDKGAETERDLCRYLRPVWSEVDRSVRTGYRTAARQSRDWGDIIGTPGVIWSVKNCQRHYIAEWWAELENMKLAEHAPLPPVRLLVVKNNGHADPGQWWCWQPLWQLVSIATAGRLVDMPIGGESDLVRCQLATVVTRLRINGYGAPLEQVA